MNIYQFLLFSSEKATGSTYLRQSVGSKSYSDLTLNPFGSSTVASVSVPNDASILAEFDK